MSGGTQLLRLHASSERTLAVWGLSRPAAVAIDGADAEVLRWIVLLTDIGLQVLEGVRASQRELAAAQLGLGRVLVAHGVDPAAVEAAVAAAVAEREAGAAVDAAVDGGDPVRCLRDLLAALRASIESAAPPQDSIQSGRSASGFARAPVAHPKPDPAIGDEGDATWPTPTTGAVKR